MKKVAVWVLLGAMLLSFAACGSQKGGTFVDGPNVRAKGGQNIGTTQPGGNTGGNTNTTFGSPYSGSGKLTPPTPTGKATPADTVLAEKDGVRITFKRFETVNRSIIPRPIFEIYNSNSYAVTVWSGTGALDGYMNDFVFITDIEAGETVEDYGFFDDLDAEMAGITSVAVMEFELKFDYEGLSDTIPLGDSNGRMVLETGQEAKSSPTIQGVIGVIGEVEVSYLGWYEPDGSSYTGGMFLIKNYSTGEAYLRVESDTLTINGREANSSWAMFFITAWPGYVGVSRMFMSISDLKTAQLYPVTSISFTLTEGYGSPNKLPVSIAV